MTAKDRFESFIVGGIAGLAIVALYVTARSFFDGADAGDWLSFSGALMGTVAAVAGAVFIEHYRRRIERNEDLALLRGALARILEGAHTLVEGPLTGLNLEGRKGAFMDAFAKIDSGAEILSFAKDRSNLAIRSLDLFSALQRVELHLMQSRDLRANEYRIIASERPTAEIQRVMREKLQLQVGALGYTSREAIRIVDGGRV